MLLGLSLVVAFVETTSPVWVVVPADRDTLSLEGARAMSRALEKTGRQAPVMAGFPAASCLQLAAKAQADCLAPQVRSTQLVFVSAVGIRERVALTAWVPAPDGRVLEEAGDKGAANDLDGIATAVTARLAATIAGVEARRAGVEPVIGTLVEGTAPTERPPRSRILEVVGFSVAGVGLVAGGVLGLVGAGQAQRVNTLMPGQASYSQAMLLEQQANGMLTAGLVTALGGAVFAILSGVLWLVLP
ncbi:MAG: hypothetical protein JNJ54_30800 [Myxococcaceae bacterium]|nr:hypothetical protein [Myxococcaceae bacterium]